MMKVAEIVDDKPVAINKIFWSDPACIRAMDSGAVLYCNVYENALGNYYFGGAYPRQVGISEKRRSTLRYRIVIKPKAAWRIGKWEE